MSDYDELNYLSQKFEKYKIFVPHEERTSIAAIVDFVIKDLIVNNIANFEIRSLLSYVFGNFIITGITPSLIRGKFGDNLFRIFLEDSEDQYMAIIKEGGDWSKCFLCYDLEMFEANFGQLNETKLT